MADEFIHRNYLIKQLCLVTDISLTSPVIQTIKTFPAADVQPIKHGRWIDGEQSQVCSVCGGWGLDSFRGCPHCFARMDGEQNG